MVGENIVKLIKGQRVNWLGHLERMEENSMHKKIFTQELEGSRRRGRTRKRWKKEVERDLQVLGVRRWRELWQIGKNGRTLFDRPKPTVGCSANGRRKMMFGALLRDMCIENSGIVGKMSDTVIGYHRASDQYYRY